MINKILDNIKGEDWVFIVGVICSMITSFYNTGVAIMILFLLIWVSVGIFLLKL